MLMSRGPSLTTKGGKTKQNKTKNKTKQNKTKQSKTKQTIVIVIVQL
jgi:hypothetical protein